MASNPAPASSISSLDDKHAESLDNKNGLPAGGELPSATSSSFEADHIFEDPKLGKYFVPIPEYEGMHR